jgi:hypothetical protein
MGVFLFISVVITPPAVSKPNDKGATSINTKSSPFEPIVPLRTAACTAAP